MSFSALSRRALERISSSVSAGVSSIQIGQLCSTPAARASLVKSESRSVPRRTRWLSTRASAQSMRCTSASFDISSEKIATPCPPPRRASRC